MALYVPVLERENKEEDKSGWIRKVMGWGRELATVGRKMHTVCNILQNRRQSRDLYIPGTELSWISFVLT